MQLEMRSDSEVISCISPYRPFLLFCFIHTTPVLERARLKEQANPRTRPERVQSLVLAHILGAPEEVASSD